MLVELLHNVLKPQSAVQHAIADNNTNTILDQNQIKK